MLIQATKGEVMMNNLERRFCILGENRGDEILLRVGTLCFNIPITKTRILIEYFFFLKNFPY